MAKVFRYVRIRFGRMHMVLSASEISELRRAKDLLENPGLAARVGTYIGTPIEKVLKRLPESMTATVNEITRKSIEKALDIALLTMDKDEQGASSNWWHKLAVVATGAGGGIGTGVAGVNHDHAALDCRHCPQRRGRLEIP
jgi:hypothetical protein